MLRHCPSFLVLVFLVAVPSLVACGRGDERDAVTTFTDSDGITIAVSDPAMAPTCSLSAEPRTVIGVASGDSLHELYRVFGARKLSTGEIAVANQGSQQVRIYDGGGRFVRAFGRAGGGPGEFRNMFGLWRLVGDTLWVGDYRPWRYQVYTADGEWVRTVQPEPVWPNPPTEWGLLSGGRPVLGKTDWPTADRSFAPMDLVVTAYDDRGALLDTLGAFPSGRRGRLSDERGAQVLSPFFEASAEMAVYDRRLALGHGAVPEVSIYEMPESYENGGVGEGRAQSILPAPSLILRWQTGDRTITGAHVEAEKARLREQYGDLDPAMRRAMLDPLISDDRPAADVFPAYITLTPGTDGSLWITEYPPPDGDGGRTHLVFREDGELRCRVLTPPGFNRYEAGEDYVLGLSRDDAGVERVMLYGISD